MFMFMFVCFAYKQAGGFRWAFLNYVAQAFTALTSNTIAGLTGRELQRLAAMTSVFGPHTTRGPSVEFFVLWLSQTLWWPPLANGRTCKHFRSTTCV